MPAAERANVETLEVRRLLIAGTVGDDVIHIGRDDPADPHAFFIETNGKRVGGGLFTPGYPPSAIIVDGGRGNDFITADPTLQGRFTILGGDGNDTIVGGHHPDTIEGGAGDDLIFGKNGDDIIYGGQGNDTIRGENGNDQLAGDPTGDPQPGDGNDLLFGGPDAADRIFGGPGSDSAAQDEKDSYDSIETMLT